MKKYITLAAFLAAGIAFANGSTNVRVESSTVTLDGTQASDTRLDFVYSAGTERTLTTTADSVTIYGTDGYGLGSTGTSLTFDIQYQLTATNTIKLVTTGNSSTWDVKTSLSESELSSFNAGNFVSRYVVTADMIGNIAAFITNDHVSVSLKNVSGLTDGGVIFDLDGTYYAASDVTFSGNYATVSNTATGIELRSGVLYTIAKITASSGASVKGIGFVASVPEPSAFGMLAGLGALVLVASRRRRK